MQGTSQNGQNCFLQCYEDYCFKPRNIIETQINGKRNGNRTLIEICAPYKDLGKRCYCCRFLDNEGGYTLRILEETIISGGAQFTMFDRLFPEIYYI